MTILIEVILVFVVKRKIISELEIFYIFNSNLLKVSSKYRLRDIWEDHFK